MKAELVTHGPATAGKRRESRGAAGTAGGRFPAIMIELASTQPSFETAASNMRCGYLSSFGGALRSRISTT